MRGETFVTRKITRALAKIKLGLQDTLYLGNIDALRDWGHAKDYVEMQWLMLQQDKPKDYVIASGIQYSVRQFINLVAKEYDIKITWSGSGLNEVAIDENNEIIKIDQEYFRPAEVDSLLGDAPKQRLISLKPKSVLNN